MQIVDRMFRKEFKAGERVLEQGALPTRSDCMYYLEEGFLDIVISGGGDTAGPSGAETWCNVRLCLYVLPCAGLCSHYCFW